MKAFTVAQAQHYSAAGLTLARGYTITRTDGKIYRLTTHMVDVTVGGNLYASAHGVEPSAVETQIGMDPDNHRMLGFLNAAMITEDEIRAGLFRRAYIEAFDFNYEDPDAWQTIVDAGYVGETDVFDGVYHWEMLSLTTLLDASVGDTYGAVCRVKLGSPDPDPLTGRPGCGVDLTPFTVTGTVATGLGNQGFTDGARTEADDWFRFGVVTFTSGQNQGLSQDVKTNTAAGVILAKEMAYPIAAGDTYSMHAGCNHLLRAAGDAIGTPYTGDCLVKFNNAVNFVGEPESLDAALKFGGLR